MNLRDELDGLARKADVYGDPDAALRTARRRRKVKVATAPLAVVLAAALAFGGMQYFQQADRAVPAAGSSAGIDYVTPDGVLHTAEGRDLALDGYGPRTTVRRVPAGWVVVRESGTSGLLRGDGTEVALHDLDASAPWALSADGRRIAFSARGEVRAARLTSDGLTDVQTLSGVTKMTADSWAGDRVILLGQGENGSLMWDSWNGVTNGAFDLHLRPGTPIEGGAAEDYVAVMDGTCLVLADPATGDETGRRCDLGLLDTAHVSPDGRYLAGAAQTPGSPAHPVVLDIPAAFGTEKAAAVPACAADAFTAWGRDGEQFYLNKETGTLTRCAADGTVAGTAALPAGFVLAAAYGVDPASRAPDPEAGPGAPGIPEPTEQALGVGWYDESSVHTADGRVFPISADPYDLGGHVYAETPAGWLVQSQGGTVTLIRHDGDRVDLKDVNDLRVSPDGTRVLVSRTGAATMSIATLTPDGLTGESAIGGDDQALAIGWVGDLVVMGRKAKDGEGVDEAFALWNPESGPFQPGNWTEGTLAAATPDGSRAYYYTEKGDCLHALDPGTGTGTGRELAKRCGLLGTNGIGTVSPDGTWAYNNVRPGRDAQPKVQIMDVDPAGAAFGTAKDGTCAYNTDVTWSGDKLFVMDQGTLSACAKDGTSSVIVQGLTEFANLYDRLGV